MNKLASIYYLQSLGLSTIWPEIVTPRDERGVRRAVKSFYHNLSDGWVLRCAEMPDMRAKTEPTLPWDVADSEEALIRKILDMQKEIPARYPVFCHKVMPMVRGGTMLVEGSGVLIEAGRGSPHELSAMFRGSRNPEQVVSFKPGMLSFKKTGEEVLTQDDLYSLRQTERAIPWEEIGAITNPVAIEFSRIKGGEFYVHDIKVVGSN